MRNLLRLVLDAGLASWAITILCTEGITSFLVPAILVTMALIHLTSDLGPKHTLFSVARELQDGLNDGSIVLDRDDAPREKPA